MNRTRYRFRVGYKGIETCPNIADTDHTKFQCHECGGPSWAHAFLEKLRKVDNKDVDQHDDRVPICRKCYDDLTPIAVLESLL